LIVSSGEKKKKAQNKKGKKDEEKDIISSSLVDKSGEIPSLPVVLDKFFIFFSAFICYSFMKKTCFSS
jgi:hypothetical protein